MLSTKKTIKTLWIFLTVNYLFCDIFSLSYSEHLKAMLVGELDGIVFTQQFLLFFAFVMEIPLLMILLSTILKEKINKTLNIAAGILMIIVQLGSLLSGENTLHYYFFSIIEILSLIAIVILAFTWKTEDKVS